MFHFFHIKFSLSVGVDLCNLTLVFFNSLNLDQSFQVESFLSLSKKSLVSLNKISLTRLQLVTYFIRRREGRGGRREGGRRGGRAERVYIDEGRNKRYIPL